MKKRNIVKIIVSALLIALSLECACFAAFTPAKDVEWLLDTPQENIFQVEGDSRLFILLDVTDDEDSKFFILTKDYYAKRPFDPSVSLFDPTNGLNLGGWLNGSFLKYGSLMDSGEVYKFPQGVVDHINKKHIWITDGEYAPTAELGTYGVGLMSQEEMLRYKEKFGVDDGLTTSTLFRTIAGWWMRSQGDTTSDEKVTFRVDLGDGGRIDAWWVGGDNEIATRPCFYLDRDFFREVRIDTNTMGSAVKAAIKKNYVKDELIGAYTQEEVQDLFGYKADINISVKDMTDSNGKTIKNLLEADKITTTVSAKSFLEGENEVILMQILYGEDNCPITFVSKNVKLKFDKEDTFRIDIRLSPWQREKGAYLKTYFLKPSVELKTLSNAVRTNLNQ